MISENEVIDRKKQTEIVAGGSALKVPISEGKFS